MSEVSTESFITLLAMIGIVIIIAALLSGLIERTGFPQVAVFLVLGAVLGPFGLGVLNIGLDSPILRIVAPLSLVMVLFTDAISLNLNEIRRAGVLTLLVLGPGTLLSAALIALAAWGLLGLPLAAAVLLGAALSSTDPVLLRGLLRRRDIPATARTALSLESSLNDVVLLPIVIVTMTFLQQGHSPSGSDWGHLILDLFVLGPGAGILVGVCAVATLDVVRRHLTVRRDYESLFSLGIAFTAYAAAEAVHGSGFLAAFAAGLTISSLDVELCDCFTEYGETTTEMALLLTFVIFGSSLIWSGIEHITPILVLFAIIALLVRPVAFTVSLSRIRLSRYEKILTAWFGPRGLSSLLLIMLPVFANIPGSTQLFSICSLVVLFSVVVHGGSPFILSRRPPRRKRQIPQGTSPLEEEEATPAVATAPPPAVVPNEPTGTYHGSLITLQPPNRNRNPKKEEAPQFQTADPIRITLDELRQLWHTKARIILLDARKERSYSKSDKQAKGSLRVVPDETIVEQIRELDIPKETWIVAYCT
ncbi:cation:proton antiporter [Ktedonosporobacter rubrisoli]|nr:cation:proton antiporter [Ktedonosporobacter rubrisoli]